MANGNMYLWLIYAIPLISIVAWLKLKKQKKGKYAQQMLSENQEAGMTEPASLHPVIDLSRCVGSGACVSACPEKQVIAIIDHKAHLVNPTSCIGHGACAAACAHDAITLVFGTETRGVDIPNVAPNFETNVPGIYIAGELGGMGLVRNASIQGQEAINDIAKRRNTRKNSNDQILDVIIIGAGPAGISASLAAKNNKLSYLTLEQESMGGTVAHFPRNKIVMTSPVNLPLIGKVKFSEVKKEKLIEFWEKTITEQALAIKTGQYVEDIINKGDYFEVKTSTNTFRSRTVLLAIGRRGTPRKLGVPGEESNKVVYQLKDPEQYVNQQVTVVGGGDSAVEAAMSIAEQPGTQVILSYRGDAFSRIKPANRKKLASISEQNNFQLMLNSNVVKITESTITIESNGKQQSFPNDGIIVAAGGILPTGFLQRIGIKTETKYGTA
ncbi:MAG: NAD(P)-binding domain-containing protein [Thalassolituus oleivorans]|uniref:NAD(P)-binding domain-containing protein n=1 Tax=Thalassolituus oleivorans TaxID=187493 RepID=UPI001B71D874|nr:NAD(P)-binding domain-containing protein [Thalassolituus oleivorans]MBQ0727138.1 NAD(P)-binding domain-containing protein [Thalassolituus oleivorans]MBQ0780796.1 NAD(P)-binding domain-containing protein [Thalassolituus oleivorans]